MQIQKAMRAKKINKYLLNSKEGNEELKKKKSNEKTKNEIVALNSSTSQYCKVNNEK